MGTEEGRAQRRKGRRAGVRAGRGITQGEETPTSEAEAPVEEVAEERIQPDIHDEGCEQKARIVSKPEPQSRRSEGNR